MSTDYLERIRQTIPEIMTLRAARAEIDKATYSTGLGSVAQPDQALLTQSYEAIKSGKALPTDLGEQIVNARRAAEARDAQVILLRELRERIQHDLVQADAAHVNDFLAALAGDLDTILDEAASVVRALGKARTVEQVVKAGSAAVDAWNKLDDLVREYSALRSAQWSITKTGWERLGRTQVMTYQWVGLRMFIADPTSLWNPSGATPPPWPHADERPTEPPIDTAEFLFWAAKNREHVWLPTIPQLIKAIEEQTARDNAAKVVKQNPSDAARERQLMRRVSNAVALTAGRESS